MLQAGMEALDECRSRKMTTAEVCVAVYLAMEAIRAISELKQETVH